MAIKIGSLFLGVLLVLSLSETDAQGNMCGMATPDPMKHCVTLRLPWQMEPIHFCIEKDKFRYRNKGSNMMHCGGMDQMRNDSLILAMPWENCPFHSVPDHCMHQNCPPPPMNRKCVVIDENIMQNNMYTYSWDCCPKYFCEEGVTPDNCRMKRLEPACVSPPQGKMNCVGFIDNYGCCTKYQCDGEGKPGMCPMQNQATNMVMRFNNSMNMNMMAARPPSAPQTASVMNDREDVEIIGPGYQQRPFQRAAGPNNNMNMMMNMECIGDAFCPGNMKCCSSDMSVYGDNRFMMRNMNPTHGRCTEPIMMATIPQGG